MIQRNKFTPNSDVCHHITLTTKAPTVLYLREWTPFLICSHFLPPSIWSHIFRICFGLVLSVPWFYFFIEIKLKFSGICLSSVLFHLAQCPPIPSINSYYFDYKSGTCSYCVINTLAIMQKIQTIFFNCPLK